MLYAQLITPDGHNHGLHSFVVPIRDTRTLHPFPGIIVGDLGEKIALNGVDNGYKNFWLDSIIFCLFSLTFNQSYLLLRFILFQNFRIPRDNLLNKNGDVTPDGKYVSPFKDPNKRFGKILPSRNDFFCFHSYKRDAHYCFLQVPHWDLYLVAV